jgi:hypothetical protein
MFPLIVLAAAALAQAGAPASGSAFRAADVQVSLGAAVQARAGELGRSDLEAERQELAKAVGRAAHGRYRSIRLVIEDIQPNRPTPSQLGASAGLSAGSVGLGGAAITGEAVDQDGRALPIRYRFFPQNLQTETNFDTWGDAEQAFDAVASALGRGAPPDDAKPWPAPHAPRAPTGTRIPPG